MSGGSWYYLCYKVEEAALRLKGKEQTPLRKAFGNHLLMCAKALHDIEWNDSGDGADEEEANIKKALGNRAHQEELEVVMEEGRAILNELARLLNERT